MSSAAGAQTGVLPGILAQSAPATQAFVAGQVVVTFKAEAITQAGGSASLAASAAQALNASAIKHMDTLGSDFYVFTVAGGDEAAAVTQLRQRSEVLYQSYH